MKIGVALSGCDLCGLAAYTALKELEEMGFEIGMVSACGLPAVTALLYAAGVSEVGYLRRAGEFLRSAREIDLDMAVAELAAGLPSATKRDFPLIISAVDVSDGRICAFSDDYPERTGRLQSFPMQDAYDALSATISPVDGLACYPYAGLSLCDFSVWYGAPVYPLKMAGIARTVSISFLPGSPKTPYEVLVKQRLAASGHLADVGIAIESEDREGELSRYIDAVSGQVRAQAERICLNVLF